MNNQELNIYRFEIPFRTIANFQGEGMYEETLEDHFRSAICEPYKFNFHAFDVPNGFGMEFIIKKLVEMGFRLGLIVTKYSNKKWIDLYNDSRIMLYNF